MNENNDLNGIFYNLAAEAEVLGGIMFDNSSFSLVFDFLQKIHFYSPLHAQIYVTIESLINKQRVAEPMTVANNLASNQAFIDAGGIEYLLKITRKYAESYFSINLTDRARLICDLHIERNLLKILHTAKDDLESNRQEDAKEKIEKIEKALFDLAEESDRESSGFLPMEKLFGLSIEKIKQAKASGGKGGIPSGFDDLDVKTSGFHKSDLIIIAGRPSMGKTSFAVGVAINAAEFLLKRKENNKEKDTGVVAIFSLEMSAEQLSTRILSIFSEINSSALIAGKVTSEELKHIVETAEKFKNLTIQIDDTPAITIAALRSRARRIKRQCGLKMIIIDYLQLIRSSNKNINRVQEVSEITQGLKAIAKELDVPVIALSQLSRAVESRDDKRPQLQDLRESGSIEQDADMVLFLYREEYYLDRTKPDDKNQDALTEWNAKFEERAIAAANKAEIIVAKNRNGPVGTAVLGFKKETTKFSCLALGKE